MQDEDLFRRALELPAAARAALAGELLESLQNTVVPEDLEAEWATEIRHRLDDVDSGSVKPVPWAEARRRIRAAARGPHT